MPNLHTKTEEALAAGKIESAPYADGQVDIETDEEFARRIALIEQEAERDAMQAKIDRLMLEYCPDEMTPEQLAKWGASQRAVVEDCPHAGPFRYCPECVDPCPLGLPQKRRGKP